MITISPVLRSARLTQSPQQQMHHQTNRGVRLSSTETEAVYWRRRRETCSMRFTIRGVFRSSLRLFAFIL